jgi:hypothetical protein
LAVGRLEVMALDWAMTWSLGITNEAGTARQEVMGLDPVLGPQPSLGCPTGASIAPGVPTSRRPISFEIRADLDGPENGPQRPPSRDRLRAAIAVRRQHNGLHQTNDRVDLTVIYRSAAYDGGAPCRRRRGGEVGIRGSAAAGRYLASRLGVQCRFQCRYSI